MPDVVAESTPPQLAALLEGLRGQEQSWRAALARLDSLAATVESVVRDELRTAFVEEFQALGSAALRAEEALQRVSRVASLRIALWTLGVSVACAAMPIVVAWAVLPSRSQLTQLRGERDALAATVAQLDERGGKIELRHCGGARRLCIRVDRSAPAFGEGADYLIVKGY